MYVRIQIKDEKGKFITLIEGEYHGEFRRDGNTLIIKPASPNIVGGAIEITPVKKEKEEGGKEE